MNENTSNESQLDKSWDAYWKGTGEIEAFSCGGASHPEIQLFWHSFFVKVQNEYKNPTIIDIASGNGAVIEYALSVFKAQFIEITSLDISTSAIENIYLRFPDVKGIVSDASSIPLEDNLFNIVTSQYGVEYAGDKAIFEAARLVANGGMLALLLHIDSGSIHRDCMQNLNAMERLQASHFLPLTIKMFDAGFKALSGENRSAYEEAASNLAPAIKELENIMKQFGQTVADNTVSQLYNDIGQIHQQIQNYIPSEVLDWLNRMSKEIEAYTQRMSSMCQSAISEPQFEKIQADLIALGFSVKSAQPLVSSDHKKPLAWTLLAKKQTTVPSAKKVST